jgi:hypothetical protein
MPGYWCERSEPGRLDRINAAPNSSPASARALVDALVQTRKKDASNSNAVATRCPFVSGQLSGQTPPVSSAVAVAKLAMAVARAAFAGGGRTRRTTTRNSRPQMPPWVGAQCGRSNSGANRESPFCDRNARAVATITSTSAGVGLIEAGRIWDCRRTLQSPPRPTTRARARHFHSGTRPAPPSLRASGGLKDDTIRVVRLLLPASSTGTVVR